MSFSILFAVFIVIIYQGAIRYPLSAIRYPLSVLNALWENKFESTSIANLGALWGEAVLVA